MVKLILVAIIGIALAFGLVHFLDGLTWPKFKVLATHTIKLLLALIVVVTILTILVELF